MCFPSVAMSSTPSNRSRAPRSAPVVPDYSLERLIGDGSYGDVWLARNALGTRRALKVVYRDSFESERPYLREFNGIREFEPVSSHSTQVGVFHVGKNGLDCFSNGSRPVWKSLPVSVFTTCMFSTVWLPPVC